MPDKVVIPFTQLEKDLLTFFEERESGLRVADVVEQFCAQYPHHRAPDIKAALWQLLAERYLSMTPEREITRYYPADSASEQAS